MLAQSDKRGNFAHGFTYAGHPVAAAVALEVQKIYAEIDVGARVDAAAKQHGLLLRVIGDRLVFAPPLVIETDEIEAIGERLKRALDEVADELTHEGVL